MLKIRLRKNLLYLLVYYISWHLRKTIIILIQLFYNSIPKYILFYLMNLGQIIGGLSIYIYQHGFSKRTNQTEYFKLELIYNQKEDIKLEDGPYKIILLIFFASYFDFMKTYLLNIGVPSNDPSISPTLEVRIGCITTIVSSLICTNALRFKIGIHHKVSLIFMSLCVLLTLILEIVYEHDNIPIGLFLFARFLVCFYLMGISFMDCIERYLADANFINPFKIVMFEGIFELIMSLINSIGKGPFKDIKKIYEANSSGKFTGLIILLIFYFLISGIINVYKIYCNIIYSPMTRSLIDYLMCPIFNIYYFIDENDFQNDYFFFFASELLSLIIVFFGCVYNEYIILFCFGLEHNTKDEIYERAIFNDNIISDYSLSDNLGEEEEDDNTSSRKISEIQLEENT